MFVAGNNSDHELLKKKNLVIPNTSYFVIFCIAYIAQYKYLAYINIRHSGNGANSTVPGNI